MAHHLKNIASIISMHGEKRREQPHIPKIRDIGRYQVGIDIVGLPTAKTRERENVPHSSLLLPLLAVCLYAHTAHALAPPAARCLACAW